MLQSMWNVLLSFAPWMLLGMAIAGVLHVALPRGLIRRQLGGRGGVVKAVAFGVPLPLCSCGVLPAGIGLKRDGASDGATVGFLISTPQTGVDSVLISASFLGWPFAIFKVLAAAVTGIVGGYVTDAIDADGDGREVPGATAAEGDEGSRGWRDGLDHALMIVHSIWGWIAFGVVVSALITVFVPESFFAGLADLGAAVPVLAALAVSLPLYVCSTASVPIAAALVGAGMPPGAALVFLMAGPATNVATVGAVHRALGRRALAVYLGTIVGGSLLAAWAFDFVLTATPAATGHAHETHGWWAVGSAIVLLGLFAKFLVDDTRRGWARLSMRRATSNTSSAASMEIGVSGMNCGNCVAKLERALLDADGVTAVEVTLDPGKAVVRGSIDRQLLKEIVEQVGFEAS